MTSSAASRDSAAKLTTDSHQFWVAHLNLGATFQSHVRFARKVQKYGDAFLKFSSIILKTQHADRRVVNINTFLASDNLYRLLITFANSLNPDQDRQNVDPDLSPNRLTL